MHLRYLKATCAIMILTTTSSVSLAAGPAGALRELKTTVERMKEAGNTLAPFAAVKFCLANRDQCEDNGGAEIVELTADRMEELRSVNSGINRAIHPMNDSLNKDTWSVDVSAGDCEDYALTKRKHLLKLGWSSRALRIAVARTSSGEGHAVLVVKTTQGDLVLDNRTSTIREWRKSDLSWIKMQSGLNPKLWVNLANTSSNSQQASEQW